MGTRILPAHLCSEHKREIDVMCAFWQVQIGHHSFTFDYVFGSTALLLDSIFDKCVKPLVEGLFHGYNATVLAYGQV
jgi:kinesin family protein 4/21/27